MGNAQPFNQDEIDQGDHALVQELIDNVIHETEYLDTTEGDSIPCISIENLGGILKRLMIINEEEEARLNKETE